MAPGEVMGLAGQRGFTLRSIQYPDARVSLLYQHGNLEVIAVEVGAGATLAEPSLWGGSSWHLVVEGQAIFQQGDRRWELLPEEALCLTDSAPYTIVNPAPERVKLLTLFFRQHRPDRRKGGGRQ
ncbi:MAG: hypothetical protein ACE5JQ_10275 [Candidatus Methylomirabilales bacterium]